MKKIVITETIIKSEYCDIIDNMTINVDKENKLVSLRTSFDRTGHFQMDKRKVKELINKLSKTLKEIK